MLNVVGTDQLDPNPATLLATRQAIDDMLGNPAIGGNTARVLSETRQQVDDVLAQSVPGIKAIDARYAELARQRDALERGGQVFGTGKEAIRPTELTQELSEGALPRGQMIGPSAAPLRLRQGARAELDRIVGTRANDRAALQKLIAGEGDWNPQKLAALYGPDRAQRILNVLERERIFAETSHLVRGNSETAARTAARREIAPSENSGFSVKDMAVLGGMASGGWGAVAAAGAKIADKGIASVTEALQARGNRALAELLTGKSGSSGRDLIVKLLMDREAREKALSPAARSLLDAAMRGPAATQGQNLPVPSRFISLGAR